MKHLFQIIFFFLFINSSLGNNYVSPEMFGAIGNGLVDDTYALQKALNSGHSIQLDGTYLITRNLTIKNTILGSGKILIGRNDVSLYCNAEGISIIGLTFDYQQHEGKLMRLKGAHNIIIENCSFLNVGNHTTKQSEGIIQISEGSSYIYIRKCRFNHCYASIESSSAGVWVNFSSSKDRCHHIYVDNCYFNDFQPSQDADAIKILGQNEEVYVYINNCEFHRCDKRALKLQARECHSRNNVIYVTRPMYCAIDFQRGHGTSSNDQIIIDYDGVSKINPNSGLLYRAICIAQGYVKVNNLHVTSQNVIDNSHQIAVCLQSFVDFDDGSVRNVIFNRCSFNGQSSLMTASEAVKSIYNIKLRNIDFKSQKINKTITNIENQCKASIRKFL